MYQVFRDIVNQKPIIDTLLPHLTAQMRGVKKKNLLAQRGIFCQEKLYDDSTDIIKVMNNIITKQTIC